MTASTQTSVSAALEEARRRIVAAAERAGRDPATVRLIAVTKTVSPDRVLQAIDAGIADLGENRVQEAVLKQEALSGHRLRWHLLGHLQTNKAGRAAAIFDMVHSVDGDRVAEALAHRRPDHLPPLDVCLEVELTGLPGHTGYAPDDLARAVRTVAALPNLRLRGLMTMAPPVPDPDDARPAFRRLRELRDTTQDHTGIALPELSMGMSDDYEVAVEEGSTIVRLGRALFGDRPPRN